VHPHRPVQGRAEHVFHQWPARSRAGVSRPREPQGLLRRRPKPRQRAQRQPWSPRGQPGQRLRVERFQRRPAGIRLWRVRRGYGGGVPGRARPSLRFGGALQAVDGSEPPVLQRGAASIGPDALPRVLRVVAVHARRLCGLPGGGLEGPSLGGCGASQHLPGAHGRAVGPGVRARAPAFPRTRERQCVPQGRPLLGTLLCHNRSGHRCRTRQAHSPYRDRR